MYAILRFHEHKVESAFNLSSFSYFTRSTAKELMTFTAKELISHLNMGDRVTLRDKNELGEYSCHAYIGLKKLVVITSSSYPDRVAHSVLLLANEGKLDELVKKYSKPEEMDKLTKITSDITQTKVILLQSIDQLLKRGEKIEDLMARTEQLSYQSQIFLKQSKNLNRCCIIL